MASEKAKELAAKQKAQIKAEKLRKKNSTDPADWGRTRQFIETYKATARQDPQLNWWVAGAAVAAFALIGIIGVLTHTFWPVWVVAGLFGAFTAGLGILVWRAKKAILSSAKGQPGSAYAALQMLNTKKYTYAPGINATRQLDVVHRVVGPGGIVLIGEGHAARVRPMLAQEAKKHEGIVAGTKVTQIMLGDGPNQVSLESLQKHIEKMPKVMQPYQITELLTRLKAWEATRPKAPVPKGPLPTPKGMNRSLRGR